MSNFLTVLGDLQYNLGKWRFCSVFPPVAPVKLQFEYQTWIWPNNPSSSYNEDFENSNLLNIEIPGFE